MSQCGTVGMDRYWNYIATPLFFIVITFGIFALFNTSETQMIGTSALASVIQNLNNPAPKQRYTSGSSSVASPESSKKGRPFGPASTTNPGRV